MKTRPAAPGAETHSKVKMSVPATYDNGARGAAAQAEAHQGLEAFVEQLAGRGIALQLTDRGTIRVSGALKLRPRERARIERQRAAIIRLLRGEPEKEDQASQATAGSVAEPPAVEVPASNDKDAEAPLKPPRQVLLTDRQTAHPRPGAGRPTLAHPFSSDSTRHLRGRLLFGGAFEEQIYAARERRG